MVEKNSVPSSSPFRGSVQVLQCSAIPVSESLSKALGAYFYLGKFSSGKFFINNTLTLWQFWIHFVTCDVFLLYSPLEGGTVTENALKMLSTVVKNALKLQIFSPAAPIGTAGKYF